MGHIWLIDDDPVEVSEIVACLAPEFGQEAIRVIDDLIDAIGLDASADAIIWDVGMIGVAGPTAAADCAARALLDRHSGATLFITSAFLPWASDLARKLQIDGLDAAVELDRDDLDRWPEILRKYGIKPYQPAT